VNVPVWPFAAVLGAAVGSFLNVVAERVPAGESIVHPPSRCPHCHRQLRPVELIPVVSYLALRGRCRSCGGAIPLRVLAVEVGTAVLFVVAWLRFGASTQSLLAIIFGALFIVFFVTDLEHGVIPNKVIFPAIVIALLAVPLSPAGEWSSPLIGGLLAFGVLFAIAALAPRGMGMGDVKLGAFMGLALGFPKIVPALMLAFVGGGLIVGGLWLAGAVKRNDSVPFGPYLSATSLAFLLYGNTFVDWWLTRL
jgi:prepilin signal peptidase PulO-like enzyme (type II secretory pathway)